MFKLFQRSMALQAVVILAVVALLWVPSLMAPPAVEAGEHPAVLYGLLCRWLAGVPRVAVVVSLLLAVGVGLGFNLLLANIGLASQSSLLPTLLFVLAMGPGARTLSPALLVAAMMVLCLNQLVLRGSLRTIPPGKICGATAAIALASMFGLPAVAMMLTYLLVAANYRLYGWKEWALMLLGFAAPYVPLLAVLYLLDGVGPWWQGVVGGLASPALSVGHFPLVQAVACGWLALMLVAGLLAVNARLGERPVVWQKNAANIMLLTVGGVGMALYEPLTPGSLSLFALPFAFCCTALFPQGRPTATPGGKRRRQWVYDLLFILTIVSALLC